MRYLKEMKMSPVVLRVLALRSLVSGYWRCGATCNTTGRHIPEEHRRNNLRSFMISREGTSASELQLAFRKISGSNLDTAKRLIWSRYFCEPPQFPQENAGHLPTFTGFLALNLQPL